MINPYLSAARALALATPVLLLGGAYASQYVGGLYPCEMCWWQRWPHFAAIALALLAFVPGLGRGARIALVALAALAIATSGGIGVFHAGVEYHWWQGLTACSTSPGSGGGDILDSILATPLTRCDVAPWTLFGISLAGYNAILSLGAALAIFLLLAKARQRR